MKTTFTDDWNRNEHPSKTEMILYLIKEDFKHRKFLLALESLGFDISFYDLDLAQVTLYLLDSNPENEEELLTWYFRSVDEYVKKFDLPGNEILLERLAEEFCRELISRLNK